MSQRISSRSAVPELIKAAGQRAIATDAPTRTIRVRVKMALAAHAASDDVRGLIPWALAQCTPAQTARWAATGLTQREILAWIHAGVPAGASWLRITTDPAVAASWAQAGVTPALLRRYQRAGWTSGKDLLTACTAAGITPDELRASKVLTPAVLAVSAALR